MITLTFNPSKQQPPRTGTQSLDGIRLEPGQNTYSAAEWQKLQAHPGFAALLELGAVVMQELEPEREQLPTEEPIIVPATAELLVMVVDPTKSLPQLPDLSSLTTDEATPLIAQSTDLELLQRWQSAETRKGVGNLLKDRIRTLTHDYQS